MILTHFLAITSLPAVALACDAAMLPLSGTEALVVLNGNGAVPGPQLRVRARVAVQPVRHP